MHHNLAAPSDVAVRVTCHRLNATDPRVMEIRNDDIRGDMENVDDTTTKSPSQPYSITDPSDSFPSSDSTRSSDYSEGTHQMTSVASRHATVRCFCHMISSIKY
jgi:hypothetical protein